MHPFRAHTTGQPGARLSSDSWKASWKPWRTSRRMVHAGRRPKCFRSCSRTVPNGTLSRSRKSAVQSLKRRRWTLLHSCGRGGATLIWMAASSRRLRRPSLLHHSVIGCVTSATFSCASHVPLQEHACHASTTLSVGMGTFAFSVARSISRLPYQTPRPHPTVPIAEQIYLLTYGRSRDWHAEWLRREARNGHRPMAEFEACISDGRSRENGNGRPLT